MQKRHIYIVCGTSGITGRAEGPGILAGGPEGRPEIAFGANGSAPVGSRPQRRRSPPRRRGSARNGLARGDPDGGEALAGSRGPRCKRQGAAQFAPEPLPGCLFAVILRSGPTLLDT